MSQIKISTLKNQAAFDLANKIGKKQNGRFFILISHEGQGAEFGSLSLGLKVSRKMGKAVVRNKIRRRIKGLMRNIAQNLQQKFWSDKVFVIIPRKGFDTANYKEIEKDLIWHIKKSIILPDILSTLAS